MGCCRAHHYISHIWVSQRQQRTMQTKHLHFCFWNPLPQVALWSCFHEAAPDNFGKSAGTARATAHHLNIIKTKARHFPNAYFLSISIQSITILPQLILLIFPFSDIMENIEQTFSFLFGFSLLIKSQYFIGETPHPTSSSHSLFRKLKAFKLQLSVLIMYYDVESGLFPYDFLAVNLSETLKTAKHFPVVFAYGLYHLHVGIAWQQVIRGQVAYIARFIA